VKRLRTVLVQDEAQAAGAAPTYDLPINPLSHILFSFKFLNKAAEVSLAEVLAKISKINIARVGQTQLDVNMADLWAKNCIMFGREPIFTNKVATDNATRILTVILPFGRKLFNPDECFPKTPFGENKLTITTTSTETTMDGVIFQIETEELLDATPKQFLKITTMAKTPAATGEMDVELPIGNQLVDLILWATTVPTGTAWTATVDWVKMLRDNVEDHISKSNWECLHGDLLEKIGYLGDHGAAYGADLLSLYGLVDFDPVGDGKFLFPTAGASSIKLRVNAGDTNPFRVVVSELVKVT
jgi:hypothetical protein